jgi:anti-sigma-K factor RskA
VNVKEYIASGMVESYVMGLLPDAERKEFELLCNQFPEIAEARNAFEITLEEQLLSDARKPPHQLQQQIQEKLASGSAESNEYELEEEYAPVQHSGIWKWLAAASFVLLAGAAYWAISTNNKYQELQSRTVDLETRLKQSEERLALQQGTEIPKSDFKMAAIKDASASATIYWDTVSKDVYLMIKNMPSPASGKQYQLWALLPGEDGGPVDLGTIELRQERVLYRMKNVQDARAFAITLEPKGGSPKPTSTPMISGEPVNL